MISFPFIKDDSVLALLKKIRKEALTKLYLENSKSSYHGCHPDTTSSFHSESISAIKKKKTIQPQSVCGTLKKVIRIRK